MKLNLQLFAGGHSVTIYKDAHMTTASASSDTDVQKNATVTLTLTPASGYEVANVEIISGGITITEGDSISFKMGEADVVLNVTSQKNNDYMVLENCYCCVNNGTPTKLTRNVSYKYGPSGEIIGVDYTPTTITLSADLKAQLIEAGVIVKPAAWHGEPEPAGS